MPMFQWVILFFIAAASQTVDLALSCMCETNATRQALMDLFNATGGESSWLHTEGWDQPMTKPICDWWGVTCVLGSAGWFLHLDLSNNQLAGTLPASIYLLQSLAHLDLSWNELSGSLPSRLPASLKLLNLQKNNLAGTIPDEGWGADLTGIEFMGLNSNLLVGTLPQTWTSSGLLQYLYLENNSLTGTIPPAWGAVFPKLEVLNLHHNHLAGELPSSFSQLESLRYLNIHHNNIASTLPPSWGGGLPSLRLLYLDHNRLEGSLPESWGGMGTNLETFILCDDGRRNRFCGTVGPAWRSVPSLASAISQCGVLLDNCSSSS